MNRLFTTTLLFNLMYVTSTAQVTLGKETLPSPKDVLEYQTFMNYEGNGSFRDQGEDLSWTFDDIELTGTTEERYSKPDSALLADFPNADFSFDLAAFATAGMRTDSTLELIGVGAADLFGFEFNAQTFPDPFVLRSVPMTYGDSYEDRIDLPFTIDAAVLPGIDSLELPVPGASLDSIRIIANIYKKETATAWGSLDFMGAEQQVLKVEQIDSTDFTIEVGLGVFGQILWIDASDFLGVFGGDTGGGDMGGLGGAPQGSMTHKFLAPDSKLTILEFQEVTAQDTSGMDFTLVNGRVGSALLNAAYELGTETGLSLYPNPAMDRLHLDAESSALIVNRAILLDIQGNMLKKWIEPDVKEGFDLQGIDAGAFIMLLQTQEGLKSLPFIKN